MLNEIVAVANSGVAGKRHRALVRGKTVVTGTLLVLPLRNQYNMSMHISLSIHGNAWPRHISWLK